MIIGISLALGIYSAKQYINADIFYCPRSWNLESSQDW